MPPYPQVFPLRGKESTWRIQAHGRSYPSSHRSAIQSVTGFTVRADRNYNPTFVSSKQACRSLLPFKMRNCGSLPLEQDSKIPTLILKITFGDISQLYDKDASSA